MDHDRGFAAVLSEKAIKLMKEYRLLRAKTMVVTVITRVKWDKPDA